MVGSPLECGDLDLGGKFAAAAHALALSSG
jgi:hypothetical protein